MPNQGNMMLQVVSSLLQHKQLETENAKNRAHQVRMLDMKNAEARKLIDLQKQSSIDVQKAAVKARTDEDLRKLSDPAYIESLDKASQRDRNKSMEVAAFSLYGDTGVLKKDAEGNYTGGLKPAGVYRRDLHEGDIIDAPMIKQKQKIEGSDKLHIPEQIKTDISKRNPYYADLTSQFTVEDQVFSKVVDRLKNNTPTDRDIELIPVGSRTRYTHDGYDAWNSAQGRSNLRQSISKAISEGELNVGYDEKYAKKEEYKRLPPRFRDVETEMTPQQFFEANNDKGIFRTGRGELWINGVYQGDGSKMDDVVRNPNLPMSVKVNISPDKKSATYVTLQENIAGITSGAKGLVQAYKNHNILQIGGQAEAEKTKQRWFNPTVFKLDETGTGGFDENEALAEVLEKIEGRTVDGVSKYPGYSILEQKERAEQLWNDPKSGDMHEYRAKVIEQLGYLIRQLNQDVDQTDKMKFYDRDDWQEYAASDPKEEYQGWTEKSNNIWSHYITRNQNYANMSTYDEYLMVIKRLVSMREELMLTPKENFNLGASIISGP